MNELALFAGWSRPMKKEYIYGTPRQCGHCGLVFTPRDADTASKPQIYCSSTCRNKARQKHDPIPCGFCGKQFKPRRDDHKTCSKTCGQSLRAKNNPPSNETAIKKKMAQFCCSLIHRCRRAKTDKTAKILGYTTKQLLDHLESRFQPGMSWDNYGNRKDCWSIDHIRPISTFPQTASVKEINALSNLQPMWHTENCRKRNTWERQ